MIGKYNLYKIPGRMVILFSIMLLGVLAVRVWGISSVLAASSSGQATVSGSCIVNNNIVVNASLGGSVNTKTGLKVFHPGDMVPITLTLTDRSSDYLIRYFGYVISSDYYNDGFRWLSGDITNGEIQIGQFYGPHAYGQYDPIPMSIHVPAGASLGTRTLQIKLYVASQSNPGCSTDPVYIDLAMEVAHPSGSPCSATNQCGSATGKYDSFGNCSAVAPVVPDHFGDVCHAPTNSCGQENPISGTIGCGGCSVSSVPVPANLGQPCGVIGYCGVARTGTTSCDGKCVIPEQVKPASCCGVPRVPFSWTAQIPSSGCVAPSPVSFSAHVNKRTFAPGEKIYAWGTFMPKSGGNTIVKLIVKFPSGTSSTLSSSVWSSVVASEAAPMTPGTYLVEFSGDWLDSNSAPVCNTSGSKKYPPVTIEVVPGGGDEPLADSDNYGASCNSFPNYCGDTTTGTQDCRGGCAVPPPSLHLPGTFGNACTTSSGKQGKVGCFGPDGNPKCEVEKKQVNIGFKIKSGGVAVPISVFEP